ncbi:MAG: FtsL-like putative cell division protein [Flavobacteriales bacterium]|jgi:hypothetical protein|nr:MAG: FtsL-like putative cell division protein [Flavobacteriales bacterium]
MNRMRAPQQEEQPKPKRAGKPARLPGAFVSLLSGSFLTRENVLRNMPFMLFCAGLMLVYIAYGYHTERVVRELERTGAALKEQRAEYITVRAELEKQEQQSQVAGRIGALGLRESRVPPVKIKVEEGQLEEIRKP